MFVLALILGLIGLLALYFRKKHDYFKNVGIPYAPGYFPFGSSLVWKCFSGQESLLQVADSYFDQFPNTKLFGFYKPLGEPVIAIKDLDLAKRIMITDFEHFVDRNFLKPNPKGEYLFFQNKLIYGWANSNIFPIYVSVLFSIPAHLLSAYLILNRLAPSKMNLTHYASLNKL